MAADCEEDEKAWDGRMSIRITDQNSKASETIVSISSQSQFYGIEVFKQFHRI